MNALKKSLVVTVLTLFAVGASAGSNAIEQFEKECADSIERLEALHTKLLKENDVKGAEAAQFKLEQEERHCEIELARLKQSAK